MSLLVNFEVSHFPCLLLHQFVCRGSAKNYHQGLGSLNCRLPKLISKTKVFQHIDPCTISNEMLPPLCSIVQTSKTQLLGIEHM